MSRTSSRLLQLATLTALGGALMGCPTTVTSTSDAGSDAARVVRCGLTDDADMDGISNSDEGEEDADGDGIPNLRDTDSDGDGVPDATEAGDSDCQTVPIDSDRDGVPDYLDLDSNGDGVRDGTSGTADLDGDGIPDDVDQDVDGDNILNSVEFGPGPEALDTDRDGTPDVRDLDSDNDTILDRHETANDADRDGIPNFRDLDSDNDTILDSVEAGDGVLETLPRVCENEIDPTTCNASGGECMLGRDDFADFADFDSDNDGLSDAEEESLGTNPCEFDTDGDGEGDLAEGAYEQYNCPGGTGTDCGCATSASCSIPARHFYVVLPFAAPMQERDLDFGTTIRVADVFFLTDTTGSMGGTLENVKRSVAGAGGIVEGIGEVIPDAWVGGGQHDDMPFGGYGTSPDEPFILAIGMTAPDRLAEVQAAFNRIMLHNGNDGPESQTQSLFEIVTGLGNTWTYTDGTSYSIPNYESMCLDTGWGAPCFREGALPIIVHFSDICSHNGPPGEDSSCDPYTGITPAPATWTQMIERMNRRGARYIGVNASGGSTCATSTGPDGFSPCWFMKRTAEETGSVDLEGTALVYDLPNSGTSSALFTETIVGAIETVATRVPLDVDTALRDDPTDTERVDARRFIKSRRPACNAGAPLCWVEPPGITHTDAVAGYDLSTFFGVIPGTRVTFRIAFQNDFYENSDIRTKLFVAFIDVRGGGSSVLDTRQVFIVVPAGSGNPLG